MKEPRQKVALFSSYRKGPEVFRLASFLFKRGWKILASGGTCDHLNGLSVVTQDIANWIGGVAIFNHMVVTISRKGAAATMAPRTEEADAKLAQMGVSRIDLVYCDPYDLQSAVEAVDATRQSVVKARDIGGPLMISEAAKGDGRFVICRKEEVDAYIEWVEAGKPDPEAFVWDLNARAEFEVCKYVSLSALFHGKGKFFATFAEFVCALKYGENGLQTPAALFSSGTDDPLALDRFEILSSGLIGMVNWTDVDRTLATITHMAANVDVSMGGGQMYPMAVGVKHGNPCGAAISLDSTAACEMVVEGDKRAIFGGVITTNFEIRLTEAQALLNHHSGDNPRVLAGIVAPGFSQEALDLLSERRCFLMQNSALAQIDKDSIQQGQQVRPVRGGYLVQPYSRFVLNLSIPELEEQTGSLTIQQLYDLLLADAVCKTSNSNTVTMVKDGMLIGNGVGQQDRVGCCELAVKRARDAGHDTTGAVVRSDSFFPFSDGPEALIEAGASVVFATSGSVRDDEVRQTFENGGVTFVTLPDAIARVFSGH